MLKNNDAKTYKHDHEKSDVIDLQDKVQRLGIMLNVLDGHISYSKEFKPLELKFELIFVRHGETYGNCGQITADRKIDFDMVKTGTKNHSNRIFQGDVDTDINQLTEFGRMQAFELAIKLEDIIQNGWMPDTIFYSPLLRAKDTGLPFVKRNKLEDRYLQLDSIKEMSFGSWDNRRVSDMKPESPCHLFYLNQHALVKNSGINGNGVFQIAESFCELLLRVHDTFQDLNKKYSGKKILMFSHSMFGAACCILLGKGQKIENGDYLAFDGQKKNGEYYTMPNATPFSLNFESPTHQKKISKM